MAYVISRIRTIALKQKLNSFDKVPSLLQTRWRLWCCFIVVFCFWKRGVREAVFYP